VPRSYVWHDSFSFLCVTWLIPLWRDSFTCDMTNWCLTWLIHMWNNSFLRDVTLSYVTWVIPTWHDSFRCDMTHSYVKWLCQWHTHWHIHKQRKRGWVGGRLCICQCIRHWHIHKWLKHQTPTQIQHTNEWCIIWMRDFTIHIRHGAHIHESHYICLSDASYRCVTYEWIMSYMNQSFHHTKKSWCIYHWVTLHMRESHHK